jgi:hypothetical protein
MTQDTKAAPKYWRRNMFVCLAAAAAFNWRVRNG